MKVLGITMKKRIVLPVSLLGFLGLLSPSEAYARPAPKGSDSASTVFVGGETKHEGRRARLAKGKSKHQKKIRMSEARTKGKTRPAAAAWGRQEKVACAEAFEKAKDTGRGSHFREASDLFATCARPSCGRALRKKCAFFHERIVAILPSVVPVVADAAGADTREVEVRMDGEILTSNLDGTAIVVDPGDHEFTFAKDGEVLATRRFAVEKGQRNQMVSVSFPPRKRKNVDLSLNAAAEERAIAAAPRKVQTTAEGEGAEGAEGVAKRVVAKGVEEREATDEETTPGIVHRENSRRASVEADPRTGTNWPAYTLAGVGLLGVGGYGAFTLRGRVANDALAQSCKPDCDPTSVRHVKNTYLAADISLGVGIVALLGSTYLFLRSGNAEEESPRLRTSHISGLGVEPTAAGALATVGGTF